MEGAANRALVDFIAAALKVRRADVSLINGHHNRSKTLAIATLTPEELTERLGVERPV